MKGNIQEKESQTQKKNTITSGGFMNPVNNLKRDSDYLLIF